MSLEKMIDNLLECETVEGLDRAMKKGCEKCAVSNCIDCHHCKVTTLYSTLAEEFKRRNKPSELELLFAEGEVVVTARVIYRKYGVNPTPEQIYKEIQVTRDICIDRGCREDTVDRVVKSIKDRYKID